MLMKEMGIYLQGPLQLSSQLSGGAQELSNEDSGGGDVKSDSTSWKSCQLDDIEGKEIGKGYSTLSNRITMGSKSRDNTSSESFSDHNSPVLRLQI
jgi:hypothetical protein